MTVHARRVASIPRRTATETWRAIYELVTEADSAARQELAAITGIASALITDEYTRAAPVIVSGNGPQVRVYTLHGDAAIDADQSMETPLSHTPTSGDWSLSLPCGEDDLAEATDAVAHAAHVQIRSIIDDPAPAARSAAQSNLRPTIDLAALEQS